MLTWLPFILLRFAGEKPNIFWFLPFHLLGVVGGSRLRTAARRELGTDPKTRPASHLGKILIFIGVLVWMIYFFSETGGPYSGGGRVSFYLIICPGC